MKKSIRNAELSPSERYSFGKNLVRKKDEVKENVTGYGKGGANHDDRFDLSRQGERCHCHG